jgi:predicted DNA-binding protein (MmcQ/YjbR family)
MDYQAAKRYLLSKPEAWEDYPFYPDVMVPKVRGKMFATLSQQNSVGAMNLKCDPDEALALRDIFPAVRPGYHMNKKHWNTVILDGSIPPNEIRRMMDNSYRLVVMNLPRLHRVALLAQLEGS